MHDASTLAPIVDESKLEHRRVGNTMERENILVDQPLPDRCHFPNDLLDFQEMLRADGPKCFNGHVVFVPGPGPNICGSAF